MHKLTPPAADCPKCGCEHGFVGGRGIGRCFKARMEYPA